MELTALGGSWFEKVQDAYLTTQLGAMANLTKPKAESEEEKAPEKKEKVG